MYQALGLDSDTLQWRDLSACRNMPTRFFFDDYEQNPRLAKTVDQACLSCPVMKQCLMDAVENKEWGVRGGIYLVSGSRDESRNSHKTKEVWDEIESRLRQ